MKNQGLTVVKKFGKSKSGKANESGYSNESGQAVVEAVLIIVVLLAMGRTVFSFIREQQLIQKMITQPWSYVSGMIECGIWEPCGLHGGPTKGALHPGTKSRVGTIRPKP